jgi:hypothetical protein
MMVLKEKNMSYGQMVAISVLISLLINPKMDKSEMFTNENTIKILTLLKKCENLTEEQVNSPDFPSQLEKEIQKFL